MASTAVELRSGARGSSNSSGTVRQGAHRFRHKAVAKDADGGDLRQEEAVLGFAAVEADLGRRVRVSEEPRHLRHEVVAVVHAEGRRHLGLEVLGEAVVTDAGAAVREAGDWVGRVPANYIRLRASE